MQKKTVQDNDIRSQSFSGVKWASIGHFSSQGISFVLGLVLARLLLPSDYGILGMLGVFTAFAGCRLRIWLCFDTQTDSYGGRLLHCLLL